MGSQWPSMGTALMQIPVFASSIEFCHNVLKSKGVDLIKIITDPDPKIFDNIIHSFVGIAAVQVNTFITGLRLILVISYNWITKKKYFLCNRKFLYATNNMAMI